MDPKPNPKLTDTYMSREEAEEREALQMYYENIRNGREPLPGQRHEFGGGFFQPL